MKKRPSHDDRIFMVVLAETKLNPLAPLAAPSGRSVQKRPVKRRMKVSERKQVVELYESGLSTRAVAEEIGISKTTVLNVLTRAGVSLRPSGH